MLFPPWPGRDVRRGSSTITSVAGSRSGGSLFAVAGAAGGSGTRYRSGSRLRTSESFDPKHKNIDH